MPVAALDIGGSSVKSGRIGRAGPEGRIHVTPLVHTAPADELVERLATAIRWCGTATRVAAAVPDPFDHATGVSRMTHKFAHLHGLRLGPLLDAATGRALDLRWCNDAVAAVAGEALGGAGAGYGRVLGVTLGTGLGAALIVDREPVAQAGGLVVGELWQHATSEGSNADTAFAARMLQAAIAADPHGGGAAFGGRLARFLAPVVAATGAEVLVVGGGATGSYEAFGPALADGLAVPVVPAALGAWAPLTGAAHLCFPG